MKKSCSFLLSFLLLLSGCSASTPPSASPQYPSTPPSAPSADYTGVTNTLTLSDNVWTKTYAEGGQTLLIAEVVVPKTGVQGIDDYYDGVLEDLILGCDKLSAEAQTYQELGALPSPYTLTAEYAVELNADGLFSVSRTVQSGTGGARSFCQTFCETFMLDGTKLLELDDLFGADRDVYLERLLAEVDQFIEENKADMFEDAEKAAREAFPFDNFCITPYGLSLFFPEITLAPGAMGVVRVDIPKEAFSDIWRLN